MIELLEQYLGIEGKKVGYFFGLVIGAAIVITLIYWAVFGFARWGGQMQRASDLMMAAAGAPTVQARSLPAGAGQYVCPVDGAVGLPQFDAAGFPRCPVCGQEMIFHSAASGRLALAAGAG